MQVLLIEPTEVFRDLMRDILSKYGLTLFSVTTADAALPIIEQQELALIFMSMHLPDVPATEFCMRLRANKKTIATPIIMMTTDVDETQYQRALVAGVTEIFQKNEVVQLDAFLELFIANKTSIDNLSAVALYVENNQEDAQRTINFLQNAGIRLEHYATVDAALARYQQHDYDLVIADTLLDCKNAGLGLVRKIRQLDGRRGEVPIIVTATITDQARKIELFQSGANDYIEKPVLEQELIARARNLVTNRKLLDKVSAQQDHLREMAMHDQLTSLYNRHYLMEVAPGRISEAHRQKIDISLLVFDIDHFKQINDKHGHSVGDEVLRVVGQYLATAGRHEDITARFGGEEFVMIVGHCDQNNAYKKAEKIRQQIEKLKPAGLDVTVSIGIAALSGAHNCDFARLFELADKALYKAKQSGRNKVMTADGSQYHLQNSA